MAIGFGAKLIVRTDSRIHANAPASMAGSMGSVSFTGIGGEYLIDATAVRWLTFNSGSGTIPAIGTTISQGGTSGYFLGVWNSVASPPLVSGGAMPATGYIKFREVTNGPFIAGALTGISCSAVGPDVTGWLEVVYSATTKFTVPRVGKMTTRGDWFYLNDTNGNVGQTFEIPSTSKKGLNYDPGAWIETGVGTNEYDFWPALNGVANGWSYRNIGQPQGNTDKRTKFLRNLWANGKLTLGQNYNLKATYASVAVQTYTYAGLTITGTYKRVVDGTILFDGGGNLHYLEVGDQVGFDFTSGSGVDAILTVSRVISAYQFECTLAGTGAGGNVTLRPGLTMTLTAHGLHSGEMIGCDFTTGTAVDGDYKIQRLISANSFVILYPHLAVITAGACTVRSQVTVTTPTGLTVTDIALASTYTHANYILTFTCTGHQLLPGMIVGVDFTTGTDANYQVLEVIDANTFTCVSATASSGANSATIRPGVIITHVGHGKVVGDSQYYNFTATVTDGEYPVYAVDSANQYKLSIPHLVAYAGTTVAPETGLAVGNKVQLTVSSGGMPSGIYTIRSVVAGSFVVNYAHRTAITASNLEIKLTEGYIPPAGCRVRIPNVFFREAVANLTSQNAVPNATITSRPQLVTSSAGAVDLEYAYGGFACSAIGQAYSVRFRNIATFDSVNISETATALDIDGLGVGMYGAQDLRTVTFVSCFAGGTIKNVYAHRGNAPGSNDHSFEVLYCIGQSFDNVQTGIIQFARSSGTVNIATSQNLTFANTKLFNANVLLPACVNVIFTNTDYSNRYIGVTNSGASYAFVLSNSSNGITIDGYTQGLGGTVPNVHPLSGVVNYTGCLNLKFRNIGTRFAPISGGTFMLSVYTMATALVSGGNNSNIKIQRCYFKNLRGGLLTSINSDKTMLIESLFTNYYAYGSGTGSPMIILNMSDNSLNGVSKAFYTGNYSTVGLVSVYGSHWYDHFIGDLKGSVYLRMNEPTAESIGQVTINAGIVKFNSAGGVEMRAIGAQATWEMPFFTQGHTGFENVAPIMSGGTIGNYLIEYQIDTGSGYSAWKTLSGANISAEVVTPSIGFKLKVRITATVVNTTAITFLRIPTVSTKVAQDAISYPLDTNTITFTGLPTGTDIVILTTGTSTIVDQKDSNPTSSYSYIYSGAQNIDVGFIKPGYIPQYIRNLALSTTDSSIPVAMTIDRNYA